MLTVIMFPAASKWQRTCTAKGINHNGCGKANLRAVSTFSMFSSAHSIKAELCKTLVFLRCMRFIS